MPPEKVLINIDRYGNTTAGTIPLATARRHRAGTAEEGRPGAVRRRGRRLHRRRQPLALGVLDRAAPATAHPAAAAGASGGCDRVLPSGARGRAPAHRFRASALRLHFVRKVELEDPSGVRGGLEHLLVVHLHQVHLPRLQADDEDLLVLLAASTRKRRGIASEADYASVKRDGPAVNCGLSTVTLAVAEQLSVAAEIAEPGRRLLPSWSG